MMNDWQLFIRHAHRTTLHRSLDNGLSPKGLQQCSRLIKFLKLRIPLCEIKKIYSSPARRCVETALALSRVSGLEVEVLEILEEKRPTETPQEFSKRLNFFMKLYKNAKRVCFVSHGDFLELLAQKQGYRIRHWPKGSAIVFQKHKLKGVPRVLLDQINL